MNCLDQKPTDCSIHVSHDFDGWTCSWNLSEGGLHRHFIRSFIVTMFVAWVFGMVFAIGEWRQPGPFADHNTILLGLRIWMLAGVPIVFVLIGTFLPSRPEIVKLYRDHIEYDSGRSDFTDRCHSWILQHQSIADDPFQYLTAASVGRKQVAMANQRVRTEYVRDSLSQHRLYLTDGRQRIEIRSNLRSCEREWLAKVIHDWMSQ